MREAFGYRVSWALAEGPGRSPGGRRPPQRAFGALAPRSARGGLRPGPWLTHAPNKKSGFTRIFCFMPQLRFCASVSLEHRHVLDRRGDLYRPAALEFFTGRRERPAPLGEINLALKLVQLKYRRNKVLFSKHVLIA